MPADADADASASAVVPGTLYLVAVPIGNPRDITLRALDVLRGVDLVAAEDTRHFATLARQHGITTRAVSHHEYNEEARARELVARLLAGESVAVVSDAGTPLLNDPGFPLVAQALAAGVPVTSLPGASAITTALAASGIAPVPFLFLGFPPRSGSKRRAFLNRHAATPATLVLFESPHRLRDTLADALATLGDRAACLARNLSKRHERWQRGPLSALLAELDREETVRGEATLVIAGAPDEPRRDDAAPEQLAALVTSLLAEGADSRAIFARLTGEHGLRRREAYDLLLRVREGRAESADG